MATQASARPSVPRSRRVVRQASTRFDWAMAVLSTLLVAGFYLDLWAHAHGRSDNTFFTPWHAVLYSMLAAVGVSSRLWPGARGGPACRGARVCRLAMAS